MSTSTSSGGPAPLLESACHEAGHVFVCVSSAQARLEFARAATSGRGTSRLVNAGEIDAELAAQIAVAGRISEEVLLGLPGRSVPDNDGYLLAAALTRLSGAYTEDHAREHVRRQLTGSMDKVRAIAELLAANADTDVSVDLLREAAQAGT
jgi:hypothetical protein